jgi:hypothetical protein
MKWIKGRRWFAGIMAVPSLAIAFLAFSFEEPCACYTPSMELAMYVDIPYMQVPTLAEVQNGFAKKFPSGRQPSESSLLRFDEEKDYYSIIKSKNAWVCTYWLKASLIGKKGYRVTIDLDSTGNVRRIQAVWLESWFGIATKKLGGTV